MPEGSEAQQNFIPEPQQESPDETANLLAADKARDAGAARAAAANDNYNPYTEEAANDNNIPQENNLDTEAANDNYSPYSAEPANDNNTLDPDQQTEIAVAMASQKQGLLAQIRKQEQELDQETDQLISGLENFKQTRAKKFLSFFQPRITFIIDGLIEILKKQATRLSFRARIAFLTGALTTIGSLISMLKGFKFITASLDALESWIKAIAETAETIIGAIIIFLIGFLWVPFEATLFYIGKIPLFKGKMTQQIIEMIEKLQTQQDAWQQQLIKLKMIVARQDQRKSLEKQDKQLQRQARR